MRIVCAALFMLGIALVDLSTVWAQSPAPAPSSVEAAGHVAGPPGCAPSADPVNAVTLPSDRGCAEPRLALSHCFTSDCRPGATLLATSRPHSALSRFVSRTGPDTVQPGDLHAHRVTPLALLRSAQPGDDDIPRSTAPARPARTAGADRSIPRPPPA
jgi:hypothetical protein